MSVGVPAAGTMHIVLNIGLQSLTNSEVKFDVSKNNFISCVVNSDYDFNFPSKLM